MNVNKKNNDKIPWERKFYYAVAFGMILILASLAGPKVTILGIIFILILKFLRFIDLY